MLALLLFLLLWIFFSLVTHIAPFNTSVIWVPPGESRRIGERTTMRCRVSAALFSLRPL